MKGRGFSKILKENYSIDAGNFPVVLDTPNIYSRVRTNMEGRKSIIVDQFHQDFLEVTNFFGGGAFLRFSWPHKKCDRNYCFLSFLKLAKNSIHVLHTKNEIGHIFHVVRKILEKPLPPKKFVTSKISWWNWSTIMDLRPSMFVLTLE